MKYTIFAVFTDPNPKKVANHEPVMEAPVQIPGQQ